MTTKREEPTATVAVPISTHHQGGFDTSTGTSTSSNGTMMGVPLWMVSRCLILLCCGGAMLCYSSHYIWLPFRETDLYAWAPGTMSYRAFSGTAYYVIPQEYNGIPEYGLQLLEQDDEPDHEQNVGQDSISTTVFPAMQVFFERAETYHQFRERVLSQVIPFVRDRDSKEIHRAGKISNQLKDFKRKLLMYYDLQQRKQQQQQQNQSNNDSSTTTTSSTTTRNVHDYGEDLIVQRFDVLVQVLPFPKHNHHPYFTNNNINININDNDDWITWLLKTNHPCINVTVFSNTEAIHKLYAKNLEPMPYERSYTSSISFHILMALPIVLLCINQAWWNRLFGLVLQQGPSSTITTTAAKTANTFLFHSPRQALFRPFPNSVLRCKHWLVDPLAIIICYLEAWNDLNSIGEWEITTQQRMTRAITLFIMSGIAVAALLAILSPKHHQGPQRRRSTDSTQSMLTSFWNYVSILIPILQAFVLILITYSTCKYEGIYNVRLSSFSMQRAILSQFLLSGIWTDICWRILKRKTTIDTASSFSYGSNVQRANTKKNDNDSRDMIHSHTSFVPEEAILLDRATIDAGISKFITAYLFYSAGATKVAESAASHVGGYGGFFGFLNDRYIVQLALRGRFGLDDRPYPLESLLTFVPRSVRWAGMATVLLMELSAIASWWHFFYHLPIWFVFMTGSSLSIGVPFRADLLFGVVGETMARNIWYTLESVEFLQIVGFGVVIVLLIRHVILMIRRRSTTKTE